jgi:hypothetical protein
METFLALAVIFAVVFGMFSAVIGSSRGIDGVTCFFMGLFFGPFGLLFAAIVPAPIAPPTPIATTDAEVEPAIDEMPQTKSNDIPEALGKLANLRDRGALTEEEFATAKASLLKQL